MQPRIIDIAKAANVSPSAVSLALNNKEGVSIGVRQKIIAIAAEMGYKNTVLDLYETGEKNTIKFLKIAKHGHIVNERHNAFITDYIEGIEIGAKKRNYKLEVSFFNKISIEEIVNSQKDIAASGLIILGTELNAHELNFFTELPQPVVFIDTYFPFSAYDCIDMDNFDGVFKVIQYLYNAGHRSIGLVKSNYETRNIKDREAGFREAMEYFSLPVQEKFFVNVDPTFDSSYLDIRKFLDRTSSLPTAFFCMTDIIAYGCIKALRNYNYRVPEDISIVGFDDLPSSTLSEPPLTTIQVSNHQIGLRALEKLSERLKNQTNNFPERILVAGKLIVRDSVKKL
ncbi:MAG: LacI family DNA-binding transcriptional regulator [Treponema sp.]|jgi:LacI family transcriptional regulator|nr:LacI family DNA-binding transcriptional regulator [Treponema sp.]